MPTTIARTHAPQKVDIPAFVDSIREVNKNALRMVSSPVVVGKGRRPDFHQALAVVLEELEKTIKVLRVVAVEAPSTSGGVKALKSGKHSAKQGDTRFALVLDTTEAMVSKGQLVTPVEFQELMGWSTRQAVSKAAQSHRIFSLTYKAERYFPAFYADPAYDRKHLEAVSKALGDLPGGSKLQFFLTRKGSLGGDTPLQALAAGRVAKVKDVAAAFAEGPAQA